MAKGITLREHSFFYTQIKDVLGSITNTENRAKHSKENKTATHPSPQDQQSTLSRLFPAYPTISRFSELSPQWAAPFVRTGSRTKGLGLGRELKKVWVFYF